MARPRARVQRQPRGELEGRLRRAVSRLPAGLRDHVVRVEAEAARLAAAHGVDTERLRLAVLGHDLARAEPPERLLELAREYVIEPDAVEVASPILLHGPIAARMLARDYGIDDAEILDAVAWHTTARPGMSTLEGALFAADKVEPDKVRRKPGLAAVRNLALTDLDAAVLAYLDLNLVEAVERGWQVHARTVEARNELLARRSGQK